MHSAPALITTSEAMALLVWMAGSILLSRTLPRAQRKRNEQAAGGRLHAGAVN